MRKIRLYISMSLDGYIADKNGDVSWLSGHGQDEENIDTYSEFIKNVDTVIMGWNTYHQIVTELSPQEWVYADLKSYVITHRNRSVSEDTTFTEEDITFTSESPCQLAENLRSGEGKDIWICGGAEVVRQLMERDMIDVYHIAVMPTILGGGIRLFGEMKEEKKLRMIDTQSYNGIIETVYERR